MVSVGKIRRSKHDSLLVCPTEIESLFFHDGAGKVVTVRFVADAVSFREGVGGRYKDVAGQGGIWCFLFGCYAID